MTDDRESHTVELDPRVYEHVTAMAMPDESPSDTLARLLGLSPDPATVAGDELSTPLPDDPVVPDALAQDPTAEPAAVEPADVPDPATAPTDVDDALGELAGLLDEHERTKMTALLEEIDDADADTLDAIVDLIESTAEQDADAPSDADAG